MTSATFESVMPYLSWTDMYTEKNVMQLHKKKESIYESCEDACINLRKYYPTFHVLPDRVLWHLEILRNFESSKKLDWQLQDIWRLKHFFSEKAREFIRLDWFEMSVFLSLNWLDEMSEYVSEKFINTVARRKNRWITQIQDLVKLVENNFFSHAMWYIEQWMNKESRKIQSYYFETLNEKKKKVPEEQRIYLKDTIASLTEYKNNLLKQYKYLMRKKVYTDAHFHTEPEVIKLREIKKPFVEVEKVGTIWRIVNKVKSLFSKIF